MKKPDEYEILERTHEAAGAHMMQKSPRADELITCLEGEIAKRDEELAACRVAVENCEVFRARIVELEAEVRRWVIRIQQRGLEMDDLSEELKVAHTNISGLDDLVLSLQCKVIERDAELAAIKAQEPVAEVKHGPLDSSGWPEFVRVKTIGDFDLENLPNGMKFYAAPVSEVKAHGVVMPRDIEKSFLEWASAQLKAPTQLAAYMAGADEVARLNAAPAAPAADAWIPVSERLPNIAQEVIAHSEFDGVCAGVLDSYGEWFAPCSEYKLIRVTSWIPMPTKIEASRHD